MSSSSKLKVYELAKELGHDSQHLVDLIQRLGIDIKNSMSVMGSEEVRTVREHFRKNRAPSKNAAPVPPKNPMTEKRVGATVIRRRTSTSRPEGAPLAPLEAPTVERAQPEEGLEAPLEEFETLAESEETVDSVAVEAPEEVIEEEPFEVEPTPEASAPPPLEVERRAHPSEASLKPTPPPSAGAETKPSAPPPPAAPQKSILAPKPKRIFPSIIKKVATEQYLGETVGPKLERKERPKTAPAASTGVRRPTTPGTTGTTSLSSTGLKRVKEVEFAQTEAQKEAAKRRVSQRENSVFRSADYLKRELIHATKKKKGVIARPALKTLVTTPAEHKRVVEMQEKISIGDLAKAMGVKAGQLIGKLMGLGVTATINQSIDYDTAALVAPEFKYEVKQVTQKDEDFIETLDLSPENLKTRPPVVTIMGHVDHGKTSLLDAIRKTKVAAGEAGGITQHVGAYTVQVPKGKITFIDTPGHEAFTAMRARGAKVTDIVILVVSAVDGVMPQTIESVNHAKAGSVPIIVAVNKTDLPDANPDRVKQTLAGHDLNPEEWGGDTIYVNVSAKTGKGLDQLLESILLQAEMMELKANYDTDARGTVIEARLDKNRGPVASVLVQHGVMRIGDTIVSGATFGKIRAMSNSFGQRMTEANPGDPVEVLGIPTVLSVGDEFFVADEKDAKDLADLRAVRVREAMGARPKLSVQELLAQASMTGEKELRVILKADVQGSAEALKEALSKFPSDRVKLRLLLVGAGGITESDINLAAASNAVILGFNVRPDLKSQKLADQEGVTLKTYSIIYDLLEEAKGMLEGKLDKEVKEKVIGRAEVREVFSVPKVGTIAGSSVIDGKVQRGCFLRLLRDSRVIYEGKISSLRRFKEDVREVAQGFECGIGLENFNDVKLGDQFEAFLKEEIKGSL